MMKNSIFLSLCIYNLEVLTYNLMKLFIEILTSEKFYYFSLSSQLCTAAINRTRK